MSVVMTNEMTGATITASEVVGGFSGEEIADILSLNKNTVMTRLFRARNQLKEMMDGSEHYPEQQNG